MDTCQGFNAPAMLKHELPKDVLMDTPWFRRCNLTEREFPASYMQHRLHYDIYSGWIYFKINFDDLEWSSVNAGTLAHKTYEQHCYLALELDGHRFLVHRVACAIMNGEWPPYVVDHKSGQIHDNSWDNLRPATFQQNVWNAKRLNKSGFIGVEKVGRHYQAKIVVGDRRRIVGSYDKPELAAAAYDIVAIKLRGEFAKTNFSLNLINKDPLGEVMKEMRRVTGHKDGPLREAATNLWSDRCMYARNPFR